RRRRGSRKPCCPRRPGSSARPPDTRPRPRSGSRRPGSELWTSGTVSGRALGQPRLAEGPQYPPFVLRPEGLPEEVKLHVQQFVQPLDQDGAPRPPGERPDVLLQQVGVHRPLPSQGSPL